jgi:hypothetical protein
MRLFMAIAALSALAACAAVPEVKLSAKDRADCIRSADPTSNFLIMSPFNSACLEYGRKERMSGVWYLGFEDSSFAKGVRSVPLVRDMSARRSESAVWINLTDDAWDDIEGNIPEQKPGCTRATYMEFEGRKAIRSVPPPLDPRTEVILIERVLRSQFVGYVTTVREGKAWPCPWRPSDS